MKLFIYFIALSILVWGIFSNSEFLKISAIIFAIIFDDMEQSDRL